MLSTSTRTAETSTEKKSTSTHLGAHQVLLCAASTLLQLFDLTRQLPVVVLTLPDVLIVPVKSVREGEGEKCERKVQGASSEGHAKLGSRFKQSMSHFPKTRSHTFNNMTSHFTRDSQVSLVVDVGSIQRPKRDIQLGCQVLKHVATHGLYRPQHVLFLWRARARGGGGQTKQHKHTKHSKG